MYLKVTVDYCTFRINCNVDLVVSGTILMSKMNASAIGSKDHEQISSIKDLEEAFAHFFSHGLPAERYMTDGKLFQTALDVAEHQMYGAEVSLFQN